MNIVKENISFERGKDPKDVLHIGEKHNFYKDSILNAANKIREDNNIKRPIDSHQNKATNQFWAHIICNNELYSYYLIYDKNLDKFVVVFDNRLEYGTDLFTKEYDTLEEAVGLIKEMIEYEGYC
jgi:hypothetical protein